LYPYCNPTPIPNPDGIKEWYEGEHVINLKPGVIWKDKENGNKRGSDDIEFRESKQRKKFKTRETNRFVTAVLPGMAPMNPSGVNKTGDCFKGCAFKVLMPRENGNPNGESKVLIST